MPIKEEEGLRTVLLDEYLRWQVFASEFSLVY